MDFTKDDVDTREVGAMQAEGFAYYRKTTATLAKRVEGPFRCLTQEGYISLDAEEGGWLAIDSQGYPYPISLDTFADTYEPLPSPLDEVDVDPEHAVGPVPDAPGLYYDPPAMIGSIIHACAENAISDEEAKAAVKRVLVRAGLVDNVELVEAAPAT